MGLDQFDWRQSFLSDLLSHGNSRKESQFAHAISIGKRLEFNMRQEEGRLANSKRKGRDFNGTRQRHGEISRFGQSAQWLSALRLSWQPTASDTFVKLKSGGRRAYRRGRHRRPRSLRPCLPPCDWCPAKQSAVAPVELVAMVPAPAALNRSGLDPEPWPGGRLCRTANKPVL